MLPESINDRHKQSYRDGDNPLESKVAVKIEQPISEKVPVRLFSEDPSGQLVSAKESGVSAGNSTTTTLASNGVFTGQAIEVIGFHAINVNVFSDVSSAQNGLEVQFSQDGITWDHSHNFTIYANDSRGYNLAIENKFIRIKYTNGPSAQSSFRLLTVLKSGNVNTTTYSIEKVLYDNYLASTVKSVIAGKREDGLYSNASLSNTSSLKVAVTDRPSEVRGRTKIEKAIHAVAISATPTNIHTVTSGKTLYVESMIISDLNSANVVGQWRILDGADTKISFIIPDKASGAPAAQSGSSPSLPEPIPFTTSFNVVGTTGDITLSLYFIGYEEDN